MTEERLTFWLGAEARAVWIDYLSTRRKYDEHVPEMPEDEGE